MKTFRVGFTDFIEPGIPISCYYKSRRLPNWVITLGSEDFADGIVKVVPLVSNKLSNELRDGQYQKIAERLEPVIGIGEQMVVREEDTNPSEALVLARARELTSSKFGWKKKFRKFEDFPGKVLIWGRVQQDDLLPLDDLLVIVKPKSSFRIVSSERKDQYYYWSGREMILTIPET